MTVTVFGAIATIGSLGFLAVSIILACTNASLRQRLYWILAGSLIAIAGSLTLSEVYTLPPCTFCWWQRIGLYPISIIALAALSSPSKPILRAIGALATFAALLAVFHVILQLGIVTTGVCSAGQVACTRIDLAIFGFMTIPAMSLAMALGIAVTAFDSARRM
jgi:disulfide bond formation protein DsbB